MEDAEAAAVAKALGHRIRLEFLHLMRERGTLSPSEYAEHSGEPLGNSAYHVRALAHAQVIEIVATFRRRGATETRYALGGRNAAIAVVVMDLLAAA